MRVLIKAELPVETGNSTIKSGKLSHIIESILGELKPEAAYFLVMNGKRTAFMFADMQDPSQIPTIVEPWFLGFNANVEITPAMKFEDLRKAGPAMEHGIKKYG